MIPALTIRQPWADAVIRGDKTVENRTWRTAFRGTIAIHAGTYLDTKPRGNPEALALAYGDRPREDFDRGVVLGLARLVDCHLQGDDRCGCSAPWAEWSFRDAGHRPTFHWILTEPRRFVTPIRARGALQLWTPDPSVAHLLTIGELA